MPVLIVSEKTWPHDGFFEEALDPVVLVGDDDAELESGLSTDLRPIVTAASFLCALIIELRSTSQSASPEITSTGSSSPRVASRTEPWYRAASPRPSTEPGRRARRRCRSTSGSPGRQKRDRDHDVLELQAPSSSMMCSMQGLPTIGTIGFGCSEVSGRRRVPLAARHVTALTPAPPAALSPGTALPQVGERDAAPEQPERPVRALVRHHRQRKRRVEEPRRRLAERVHLEVVALLRHQLVPAHQQESS